MAIKADLEAAQSYAQQAAATIRPDEKLRYASWAFRAYASAIDRLANVVSGDVSAKWKDVSVADVAATAEAMRRLASHVDVALKRLRSRGVSGLACPPCPR